MLFHELCVQDALAIASTKSAEYDSRFAAAAARAEAAEQLLRASAVTSAADAKKVRGKRA
jgi:hypothetical protein